MSSTLARDLVRRLNSYFANPEDLHAIPNELELAIGNFLSNYTPIDEHHSQRVHDELLAVHNKYVSKEPEKLGLFLQVLALLHTTIIGLDRRLVWWRQIVLPTLETIGRMRLEIERTREFAQSLLNYDPETDRNGQRQHESEKLLELLIDAYLRHTILSTDDDDEYVHENEHIAGRIESVIANFGRWKPKDLFTVLDRYVTNKATRLQALTLLSSFVRLQTPRLYTATQTRLVEHLLQCLMIDTSTTMIQLALNCLIMFLPHIPSSILAHLPRLFLIYSRLLCWERIGASVPENNVDDVDNEETGEFNLSTSLESEEVHLDPSWERQDATPGEVSTPVDLSYYFTFLYGLYPVNLVNYVRRPRRYLKNINFPRAEELELDQDLIRTRTARFRKTHLLHPNFYHVTEEEELSDKRWLRSDPADLVAECISLQLSFPRPRDDALASPSSHAADAAEDILKNEDIPPHNLTAGDDDAATLYESQSASDVRSALGSQHRAQTQVFLPRNDSGSSTALLNRNSRNGRISARAIFPPISSHAPGSRAQDDNSPALPTIPMAPVDKSLVHKPSSSSIRSGTDTTNEHQLNSPSGRILIDPRSGKAAMHQKIILLTNDLNFERFLKQQHLSHIGELQRRRISDATTAANVENLASSNKSLRSQLNKTNESYAALKRETATSRSQSKKFETELAGRVRALREAERTWRTECDTLRYDLEQAQRDGEALMRLVTSSEARELLSQQQVASMQIELEQVETLQKRVKDLEGKVENYEAKELTARQAIEERETLASELQESKFQVANNDGELQRRCRALQQRVVELEAHSLNGNSQNGVLNGDEGWISERARRLLQAAKKKQVDQMKELAHLRQANAQLDLRCRELEESQPTEQVARHDPSTSTPSRPGLPRRATDTETDVTKDLSESVISTSAPSYSPSLAARGIGGSRGIGNNSNRTFSGRARGTGIPDLFLDVHGGDDEGEDLRTALPALTPPRSGSGWLPSSLSAKKLKPGAVLSSPGSKSKSSRSQSAKSSSSVTSAPRLAPLTPTSRGENLGNNDGQQGSSGTEGDADTGNQLENKTGAAERSSGSSAGGARKKRPGTGSRGGDPGIRGLRGWM